MKKRGGERWGRWSAAIPVRTSPPPRPAIGREEVVGVEARGPAERPGQMTSDDLRRRWRAYFSGPDRRGAPFPEELRGLTCGARTRAGTPCKRTDLMRSGRCKLHGGLSTGPRSKAGKAAARGNLALRWSPADLNFSELHRGDGLEAREGLGKANISPPDRNPMTGQQMAASAGPRQPDNPDKSRARAVAAPEPHEATGNDRKPAALGALARARAARQSRGLPS